MLLRAARRLGIDCTRSVMIGDRASDVAAGQAAGCRTIFIDRGYRDEDGRGADHIVATLAAAASVILAGDA
jgi:D-glycero-D-manno-heptose 1,7-bisphosphate phosphatase